MIERVFIKILYDINKDLERKKLYSLKKEFEKVLKDYYSKKLDIKKFLTLLQISLAIYKMKKEEKTEIAKILLKLNGLSEEYLNFVTELTKLDDSKIRGYIYFLITNKNYEGSN